MYSGQNLCFHFDMTTDGLKDQCINPEGFGSFLGLLESIPLDKSDSSHGSFEHTMPDSRYIVSYFGLQFMTFGLCYVVNNKRLQFTFFFFYIRNKELYIR